MVRINWTREEMILAADVSDDLGWRGVNAHNPQVVELSQLLRRADYHPVGGRPSNFRTPGSVGMKINNLNAWHPKEGQVGLRKSKAEWPIVESFAVDRSGMKAIASEIRKRILNGDSQEGDSGEVIPHTLSQTDPGAAQAAEEGGLRAVVSYRRERDPKLRQAKLDAVIAEGRKIACEVCEFDFGQTYGDRGEGYIEVHHSTPLHVSGMVQTEFRDLVLLCSNCHRMIHRTGWITVPNLKAMLA